MDHVSASQIDLVDQCERKYGFKYIDRVEVTKKPEAQRAADLGIDVQDNQIDPYLLTGKLFDFTKKSGEIAQALVPLLPKPKAPGMSLRHKFEMFSPSGLFKYVGEFDMFAEDSGIVPGLKGGRHLLGDVKTSGNLVYAKTESDLKVDPQAQLYAANIMVAKGVDELDVVWWYTRTKGRPKAQRTYVIMRASEVFDQFGRLEEVGKKIVMLKHAGVKAAELKPNARMCDKYGGCPFNNICNLSPAVHHQAINQEALMDNDFLAGLRKQTTPAAPIAGVPAAAPAPANPLTEWPGENLEPGVYIRTGNGQALQVDNSAHGMQGTFTVTPKPAAPSAPTELPAWATAPVDPLHARPAAPPPVVIRTPAATVLPAKPSPPPAVVAVTINPPESALPPAPPVGAPAPAAEKKTRGKAKDEPAAVAQGRNLVEMVGIMRELGIKYLSDTGIELFAVK